MIKGYITNLGKYNEGELVGKWITFPINDEELEKVFEEIGIDEYYEEFFFADWETQFDLDLGEYESIEAVNELAEQFEALDEYDLEKLEAILEANGGSAQEALDSLEDCIYYSGCTLEDVAYEIVNDCYDLPEIAQRYFDYEAFARDLRFDGYTETANGVICTC